MHGIRHLSAIRLPLPPKWPIHRLQIAMNANKYSPHEDVTLMSRNPDIFMSKTFQLNNIAVKKVQQPASPTNHSNKPPVPHI